MSLSKNGTNTLTSNVTNISSHGFWIIIDDKEYFISFHDYPSFKKATINAVFNVKKISPRQLYWEDLDIDIELEALEKPEHFPLQFIYNKD